MAQFTVLLTPEPEAGGFSVSVPALPGCYSQGESVEDALANIREAIGLYIGSMAQDGDPIPSDVKPIVTTVDAEPIAGRPITEQELAAIAEAPPWDGRSW